MTQKFPFATSWKEGKKIAIMQTAWEAQIIS